MDRENPPEDRLYLHPEWIIDRAIRTEAGIRYDAQCVLANRIWRCDKFKKLSYQEKKKVVQQRELCLKCLSEGH
jgi:hypothetical protein